MKSKPHVQNKTISQKSREYKEKYFSSPLGYICYNTRECIYYYRSIPVF